MKQLAENIWVLRFPLSILRAQIGRTVIVIRLSSGKLIIHSTGPFSAEDVATIKSLGEPCWLVEATLFHDTFAAVDRAAFTDVPYLAPEGFPVNLPDMTPLHTAPLEWGGELQMLVLEGMPKVRERVFFHPATRTLIVADLLFNFGPDATSLTRKVFRWVGGIKEFPGISRFFCLLIRDRKAFAVSIQQMMQWDFDRLIVGHVETGAKAKISAALQARGF